MLLASFLYKKVEINSEPLPPFADSRSLFDTIDSIPFGDIPWEGFKVKYDGEIPDQAPSWMTAEYDVWYRNPLEVMEGQLGNPEFARYIDYAPKEVKDAKNGRRQYMDLMSGEWAWDQANKLAMDTTLHGAMFAPVILGSDKTTVSVATGQNEYYPLYASLGNVQNRLRRAHKGALTVIGFLAIPKTSRDEQDSVEFRQFRRQLLHSSIARILMPLKRWMTEARITRCGDGHFRRVVYGLGPYIADYPEQCVLACVVSGWCPRCIAMAKDLDSSPKDAAQRSHDHTDAVHQAYDGDHKKMWDGYGIIADVIPFTSYFPRANIHELLSPDLLHQIIKGTFKDHLVQWVVEYLEGLPEGKQVLAEMDRRVALAPPFSGLRRFPEGRDFKQWTGNDSKALMKVFLAAIKGLVPDGMVRAISAFMEFCYLVRLSEIDELVLDRIDKAVEEFHQEREIFRQYGIRQNFNLPRQHSLCHYRLLIQQFGAPNGLCSSITESKHIEAVKKAWRRSSRNKPLGEMLLTNQRIDKLAAARVAFEPQIPLRLRDPRDQRQTLQNMRAHMPVRLETISEDEGEGEVLSESAGHPSEQQVKMVTSEGDVRLPRRAASRYPRPLYLLTPDLGITGLEEFIRRFLYDQPYPDSDVMGVDMPRNRPTPSYQAL
ncbi:hypothetical protein EST38_g7221 [Candolleomyces aberdarensis]|uniref:Uncharacterized protein n=1 Tax=Candolleomyces aberdarensis TaxID=2316362 RepID=A0A4Q2DFT2_9AGAR|nr:hypothetical protein EST38_g7221 [Candolleomyces aberdarensis]